MFRPPASANLSPSGSSEHRSIAVSGTTALALGALGVVYGDIGTSPLYAMQTVFTADNHAVRASPSEVYGIVSLVFWAITIIVSIKYVTFVMRADNGGEGGIMALTALLQGTAFRSPRVKLILITFGIAGASLFYGDGVITPAISVLSAVEGLEVAAPSIDSLVLPITVAVLTALFAIQRFGTGFVGYLFGPVMVVWFCVIAALGIAEVVQNPSILRALSPHYGASFLLQHGGVAFIALGSVVLAVTGAEALYADMGQFGPSPIRRAWFFLVFPALTLNYLGQGSLIVHSPGAIQNPFYLLVPGWGQIPMVILATLATVIASQAVISGVFSVTRQAMRLGYLPRLIIRHTSEHHEGRVYVPAANWVMFAVVIALVFGFGSATALGSAYGIAVTGTFFLSTTLFLVVARHRWGISMLWIGLGAAVFGTVELAFFTSTLTKVVHGGWVPLAMGLIVFIVLTTWRRGHAIALERGSKAGRSLAEFLGDLAAGRPTVRRVPGAAVYLNADSRLTPVALRVNAEHNGVLHRQVIVITFDVAHSPHVPAGESLSAEEVGKSPQGVTVLRAQLGFHDEPDLPAMVQLAVSQGLIDDDTDLISASYFVSRNAVVPAKASGLSPWRRRLFLGMWRTSASPIDYFRLPADRTVIVGEEIEL